MRIREFDELGTIRSEGIEEYFGKMELKGNQYKKRVEYAKKCQEIIEFIILLVMAYSDYATYDVNYIVKESKRRYLELVKSHIETDDYLDSYIDKFIRETAESTIKHIQTPYYISVDRARFIAENEANTLFNYDEFRTAMEGGMKYKTWITEKDYRVRETHRENESITIPIEDVFVVGESFMMFPKDTSQDADADEIVNCRCTIKYFK